MVEAVLAEIRCTAIAHGYNVTLGVVVGLSPLAPPGSAAAMIMKAGL